MTREAINTRGKIKYQSLLNCIQNYKDFLNTMKGFFGNDFPLIKRFEFIINKFEKESEEQYNEMASFFNNTIKELE